MDDHEQDPKGEPTPQEKTPHLAVVSLLLGALSLLSLGLTGPFAIVAGLLAKRRSIPATAQGTAGLWLATTGITLGTAGCFLVAGLLLGFPATPSLFDLPGSAASSEARYGLGEVRLLQEIYKKNHGRYAGRLEDLNCISTPVGSYHYRVLDAGVNDVRLAAVGKVDSAAEGDAWCLRVIGGMSRKPRRCGGTLSLAEIRPSF